MASSKWKTSAEILEKAAKRTLCFWGNSFWVEKTIQEFSLRPDIILDENCKNQRSENTGVPVQNPQSILSKSKTYYVVITTASYETVVHRLEAAGHVMGKDFACSPALSTKNEVEDIKGLNLDIIFSSPDHNVKNDSGGGLYQLNTKNETVTKVYDGKCRGLASSSSEFFVIDMRKGIIGFDKQWKKSFEIKLKQGSEPHGLAYCEVSRQFFIGQPGRDSIGIYSRDKKTLTNEFFLSEKWHSNKKDNFHINDLLIKNDSLFISVFSTSGNWPNDVYDGGILEIDLEFHKEAPKIIENNLWMPHSLCHWKNGIVLLESMLSKLYSLGWGELGRFDGFIRGLAIYGDYFIIGVSEHKYPERLKSQRNAISVDAGIIVFNVESQLYKFIRLTSINSVHSIVIKNG